MAMPRSACASTALSLMPSPTIATQRPWQRILLITFEYSKAGAPSLSHISFSVKKGQTVGIIGGTGSGKTTLVNLISRFYDASKGTVLLDGQNIENYTRSDLRSRIGVVPQKAALFKGSIRDNLNGAGKMPLTRIYGRHLPQHREKR